MKEALKKLNHFKGPETDEEWDVILKNMDTNGDG